MGSDVPTGTVLAGFRVESLLGEGAMGTVYLAEAPHGQRVALKLLSPNLARDERFRQRFLRESQLAAGLDHPHIVPTLASGEEDGVLYLAMAYVEGSDLRHLLRREGRLEPERAIALVAQVAEALDAAHAAGLVHRDVKPGNILVTEGSMGERAYVCDFGLARHVTSVSSLTGERGFVGTIDYVPPEQIEGGKIDARADVYSLGCVLYECLAGERPFDRESELSVVFAHLNEPPPSLSDLRPELPTAFDEVLATALAKAPDDRYSTCGELAKAARAAREGKVFARRRRRRRRLLFAGVAVLAAAGAAVGSFIALQGSAPEPSISQTAIAGAKLGLPDRDYVRIFGPGTLTALRDPPDYVARTFVSRRVEVWFASGDIQGAIRKGIAKGVEIATWDRNDRTMEGVGPCSTVAELKRAYGSRLKPVEGNTLGGKVYGYTVGKRLFFGMGPVPNPTHVTAVGLYSNPLPEAGFLAIGAGPCA
jgi:tRNA A-37 threonylcarbamoyl transferase component Bud32